MANEQHLPRKSRRALYLVILVGVSPIVLGTALFQFWKPTSFTNYGELLPPKPVIDSGMQHVDGKPFSFADLKGKWVFLTVDSGGCDVLCQRKLYTMRQVRLTQGTDMDRIERAWLIDDDTRPASELTGEYQGMRQAIAAKSSAAVAQFPADKSVRDHIYIIDPLGNVMMRYPRDADPTKIKKDVTRLLKVSRIG